MQSSTHLASALTKHVPSCTIPTVGYAAQLACRLRWMQGSPPVTRLFTSVSARHHSMKLPSGRRAGRGGWGVGGRGVTGSKGPTVAWLAGRDTVRPAGRKHLWRGQRQTCAGAAADCMPASVAVHHDGRGAQQHATTGCSQPRLPRRSRVKRQQCTAGDRWLPAGDAGLTGSGGAPPGLPGPSQPSTAA